MTYLSLTDSFVHVCGCLRLSVRVFVYLSVGVSVCLSVCLPVCLCVCLSDCVRLSVYLFVASKQLSIYRLPTHLVEAKIAWSHCGCMYLEASYNYILYCLFSLYECVYA